MSTVTQPTHITEFILARIAEDEAAVRPLGEEPEREWWHVTNEWLPPLNSAAGAFAARHNPARVLAQCKAMRRIVERNSDVMGEEPPSSSLDEDGWVLLAWETMYDLAVIWSDHPDYNPAWRVQ